MIDTEMLGVLPAASREKLEGLDDQRATVQRSLWEAMEQLRAEVAEFQRLEAATRAKAEGSSARRRHEIEFGPLREVALGAPVDWADYLARLQNDTAAWRSTLYSWRPAKLHSIVRAQRQISELREQASAFAFLDGVETWLRRALGDRQAIRPAPRIPAPTGNPQSVQKIRDELALLDSRWDEVEAAPHTGDELRRRIVAAVDVVAARGAPALDARRTASDPFGIEQRLSLGLTGTSFANTVVAGDAGAAFFVWLLRDEIIERLTGILPAKDLPGAMSNVVREQELMHVVRRRLELSYTEEAAIEAAAASGIVIPRRATADPRAILWIAG